MPLVEDLGQQEQSGLADWAAPLVIQQRPATAAVTRVESVITLETMEKGVEEAAALAALAWLAVMEQTIELAVLAGQSSELPTDAVVMAVTTATRKAAIPLGLTAQKTLAMEGQEPTVGDMVTTVALAL